MSKSARFLCFLVAGITLAVPLAAQPPINPGTDLFETSTGTPTFVNFAGTPLPADFFCPGSAPFTGVIPMQGVPLATQPAGIAGNADTLVQRLTVGSFVGGVANLSIIIRALRLTSVNDIAISCPDEGLTFWRVDACLCGQQPVTTVQAKIGACGNCGTFDGRLDIRLCLRFTRLDTGATAGPIQQVLPLRISGMPWCYNAPVGARTIGTSFLVDSNCDGKPDLSMPPTSNFHPGFGCGTDCWTQYAHLTRCHENFNDPDAHDHCVNPICGRTN